MSTRIILLEKISKLLGESIDIDKVDAIPLKLNSRTTFPYGEYEYGMVIQNVGNDNKHLFPKSFTLPTNMNGYYNFGFDFEGKTTSQNPKSYKEIAKPLSIVIKSLLVWISQNDPTMIIVFADSNNIIEKEKKINLYGSILYREKNTLSNLGYTWDFFNSPILGKSIYISKQTNK